MKAKIGQITLFTMMFLGVSLYTLIKVIYAPKQ